MEGDLISIEPTNVVSDKLPEARKAPETPTIEEEEVEEVTPRELKKSPTMEEIEEEEEEIKRK